MNPRYPIYIVSKGRWESRMTSKEYERLGIPYRIIVEQSQYEQYAAVIDPAKILILDPEYQRKYDTCDDIGDTKSKGPGAARNFAWDHSISIGAAAHWVCDDNIRSFYQFNNNRKIRLGDGTMFRVCEDFFDRYENLAMAGPQYEMFVPVKSKVPPFVKNTRIYSCNLIRNDVPYRWRGRYNEDTDLSLRMLKDGWCTVQFNIMLQQKIATQTVKGGCDADFYSKEGTMPKSKMQIALHPDVSRIVYRFGRWHHHVDYRPFKRNMLKLKPGVTVPDGPNNYGLKVVTIDIDPSQIKNPMARRVIANRKKSFVGAAAASAVESTPQIKTHTTKAD